MPRLWGSQQPSTAAHLLARLLETLVKRQRPAHPQLGLPIQAEDSCTSRRHFPRCGFSCHMFKAEARCSDKSPSKRSLRRSVWRAAIDSANISELGPGRQPVTQHQHANHVAELALRFHAAAPAGMAAVSGLDSGQIHRRWNCRLDQDYQGRSQYCHRSRAKAPEC